MSYIASVPDHATLRNYLLQHHLPFYYPSRLWRISRRVWQKSSAAAKM